MYCRNCGKELDNEAAVCPSCGVPVGAGKSKLEKRIGKILVLAIVTYLICFLTLIVSTITYLDGKSANEAVDKFSDAMSSPHAETYEQKDVLGGDVSFLIGNLGDD